MVKRIGVLFVMVLFLASCRKNIDFVDEGPFVQLEVYSASSGTYLDHFPKIITVSNDGTVTLFTEQTVSRTGKVELRVEDDAPTVEKKLSAEKVKEIKEEIEKNRFTSLPTDVTDYDVMDGVGSRITVYEENQETTVGGENSGNEQYNSIEKIIFDQIRGEYKDWVDKTKDYLFELNE